MSADRTEDVEDAASNWLIRRDSGDWTRLDQARFEEWLEASALNRVAFLRLELAWDDSARLQALGAGLAEDQPPPLGQQWNLTPFFEPQQSTAAQTSGGRMGDRTRRFAMAAGIVLAVLSAVGVYEHWDGSSDRYTTPIGGIASMPLQDGSNITLNSNSQVRVALSNAERHVDLKQGEVFIEVAKDAHRPFIVDAGRQRVVAVGTKFSVHRSGDSVEVVVTEGKVRVEDAGGSSVHHGSVGTSGSNRPRKEVGPVLLTAGAIAFADGTGVLIERASLEEAEAHLSWRNGVLMFRDSTLAAAVAEFNRYNVRNIVISDPTVAAMKVEGNFRATNVEAFVRLLETDFPVTVTTHGDQITLSPR